MKILLLASILAVAILPTPVESVKTVLQCAIEFLIYSCHQAAVGICSSDANWANEVGIKFSARLDTALSLLIWKGSAPQGIAITAEKLAAKVREAHSRTLAFTQADNKAPAGEKTFLRDCDGYGDAIGRCLTALLNRAATPNGIPARSLADFRTHLNPFNAQNPAPPACA